VSGQNGAREIIEAHVTVFVAIALPVRLGVVVALAKDGDAVALGAPVALGALDA